MASHPYISGAGNIAQVVALLRKNFPSVVTSDTVKKYGLASNNESYVINALQFIGVVGEDGKRTERGSDVFAIHNEDEFKEAFGTLVRDAYKDLFELRGEDAWNLSRDELIGYFRTTDKTSEIIGTRQTGVFRVFASLAGHGDTAEVSVGKGGGKQKPKAARASTAPPAKKIVPVANQAATSSSSTRDVALTVRIEINLPAEGSRETYDNIFQSIRANLLDE